VSAQAKPPEPRKPDPMSQQTLIRVIAKMTIPFILVFGIYVILHGEIGPGGGFQGGVIVAAGFILYGLVFGADELTRRIPPSIIDACMALGALIYASVGLACLFAGGTFLDYGVLMPEHAGDGEAWGMTIVEYGVGLTVASVMVTVYLNISERRTTLRVGEEAP
jgi:multicomponent Na+:H+ antiporter subunit B